MSTIVNKWGSVAPFTLPCSALENDPPGRPAAGPKVRRCRRNQQDEIGTLALRRCCRWQGPGLLAKAESSRVAGGSHWTTPAIRPQTYRLGGAAPELDHNE